MCGGAEQKNVVDYSKFGSDKEIAQALREYLKREQQRENEQKRDYRREISEFFYFRLSGAFD